MKENDKQATQGDRLRVEIEKIAVSLRANEGAWPNSGTIYGEIAKRLEATMLGTRVWHRLRACCIFRKVQP